MLSYHSMCHHSLLWKVYELGFTHNFSHWDEVVMHFCVWHLFSMVVVSDRVAGSSEVVAV